MSIDFSGSSAAPNRKNDYTYYAILSKLEGKANRVAGLEGNIPIIGANGDLRDGNTSLEKIILAPDIFDTGNLPMFGTNNHLLDSGIKMYTLTQWRALNNDPYFSQSDLLNLASKFKEYLSATSVDTDANLKLAILQDGIDSAIKLRDFLSNKVSFFVSQLPVNIKLHDMLVLIINTCTSPDQLSQLKGATFADALKVPDSKKERWTILIDFFENIENLKKLTPDQLLTVQKQKLILSLGLSPFQLNYDFLNTIIYAANK